MKKKLKKYRNHYFGTYETKNISLTFISFAFNLCIGLGKLFFGLFFSTYWFIITASYYIALCLSKGHLLHHYAKLQDIENKKINYEKQFIVYHRSGYFIILLATTYLALCVWMLYYNQQSTYPQYIIFGVAAVAFYKIGNAIYGICRNRKNHSPVLTVIKIINLFDACVAIVAVQCSLLTMQQSNHASSSSALFGIAISIVFMIVGMYMICRHKKLSPDYYTSNTFG